MENVKAKTVSLISKVIAVVVLLGGLVLKGLGIFTGVSVGELCTVAFSIMGVFGTVDLNIALDKFTKKE